MPVDAVGDEVDDDDDLFELFAWAENIGIWDGRSVTYEDASDLHRRILGIIYRIILAEESSFVQTQRLIAALALAGADFKSKDLLIRDIQDLNLLSDELIIKTGFGENLKRFWKKHKKKILIGAGLVAIITVAVVVTACSSGATAAAAAAASNKKGKKKKKNPIQTKSPGPDPNSLNKSETKSSDKIEPNFDKVFSKNNFLEEVVFDKDSIKIGDQNFTYQEVLKKANREALLSSFNSYKYKPTGTESFLNFKDRKSENTPKEKWVGNSFKEHKEKTGFFDFKKSGCFHTEGIKNQNYRIGGINGMNTSFEEADSHASYIKKFSGEHSVDWVYNRTHGLLRDSGEIFFLNLVGVSPNTANMLRENWTEFHENNKNNPKAKYLQICHSQGAIHVRNALEKSPEEIRDRVIVVAIAPGAIVSEEICYLSFNYASKKDPIPKAEFQLMFSASLDLEYEDRIQLQETLKRRQAELILLDSDRIAHSFQDPIFKGYLKLHINGHKKNNGEYE